MAHRVFRNRQGRRCRKLRRWESFGTGWDSDGARVVAQACAKSHSKCAAPCHNSRENTGKQGRFRELCNSARGPRRQVVGVPKLEGVRRANLRERWRSSRRSVMATVEACTLWTALNALSNHAPRLLMKHDTTFLVASRSRQFALGVKRPALAGLLSSGECPFIQQLPPSVLRHEISLNPAPRWTSSAGSMRHLAC